MFVYSASQVMSTLTLIEEIDSILGLSPDSFYQPVVIVCSFIVLFYLLFYTIKVVISIAETSSGKW